MTVQDEPVPEKLPYEHKKHISGSKATLKCLAFWCCTSVGSSEKTLSQ